MFLQCEAVPESLKNMLLVMHTAGILGSDVDQSQLWKMTWERIDMFLPHLRTEVFKPHETEPARNVIDRDAPVPASAEPAQATTPPATIASSQPTQTQDNSAPAAATCTATTASSRTASPGRASPQNTAPAAQGKTAQSLVCKLVYFYTGILM